MFCPYCGNKNPDNTVFCNTCGRSIRTNPNNPPGNMPRQEYNQNKVNNKSIVIICITLLLIAVIAASTFIYLSNNDDNGMTTNKSSDAIYTNVQPDNNVASDDASVNSAKTNSNPQDTSLYILSGSFYTGSSLSDKTHCNVYVGKEHAGQNVKISVLYSRDGSNLNEGKIVPVSVDDSGYVSVASASSFKYYPDYAIITLYDNQGNVLDTRDVAMNAASGTQYF